MQRALPTLRQRPGFETNNPARDTKSNFRPSSMYLVLAMPERLRRKEFRWHSLCISGRLSLQPRTTTMKTQTFESTYAMLLRSDEKERSVSETAVYLLLIVAMAFSVWQAAHQRVTVPNSLGAPSFAQIIELQDPGV